MPLKKPIDTLMDVELVEGVSIQLRPAGFLPRAIAFIIDYLVLAIVSYLLGMVLILVVGSTLGPEIGMTVNLLVGFLVSWFYFPLFEMSRMQGTVGKKVMKLKVVTLSGAPAGFGAVFTRSTLKFVDFLGGGLAGLISIFISRYNQRLGDLAAATLVVYQDSPMEDRLLNDQIKPIAPPISLSRKEQLAFLEFASRFGGLSEARREELAVPLAALLPKGGEHSYALKALGVAKWLELREG